MVFRNKTNKKLILLVIVILIVLTGCNTGEKYFTYPIERKSFTSFSNENKNNISVAVAPFVDKRGKITIKATIPSSAIVLPLLPFVQHDSDRPERNSLRFEAVKFNHYKICEDITNAVTISIRNSNLFKETVDRSSEKYNSINYVLYGKINKLSYRNRFMLYGLTCVGSVILGTVGFPIYTHHGEIDIDLFLYDRSTRKNIWCYKIKEDGGKLQGFYYNIGRSIITANPKMGEEYGEMLQAGMNKAVHNMKENVFQATNNKK